MWFIFLIHIIYILYISCARPDKKDRKFSSEVIDDYIQNMKNNFTNLILANTYESCYPNTLDTTVFFSYENNSFDTFVITGDIEAMWQRDSSFQTIPYLQFANKDPKIKKLFLGLINRQVANLLTDPYANAFNKENARSPWWSDRTFKLINGTKVNAMNDKLWERKYELDSPLSSLFLSYQYYRETNDTSFINDNFLNGIKAVIKLVEEQIQGSDEEAKNGGPFYEFQRRDWEPYDSLHHGTGFPGASCGLVKTSFRSSDDAVVYPFNIAENAFLVTTFKHIAEMLGEVKNINKKVRNYLINNHRPSVNKTFHQIIDKLLKVSKSVNGSIYKNGIMNDSINNESYFVYEVDCFGNKIFMDDPGYPSLTSLPFFGFVEKNDSIYLNTRKRILSNMNPYYFKGLLGEGLGSSHTQREYIWPLYTIMRGLTSDDNSEIKNCIDQLVKSAEGTNFMHESFHVDNAKLYTRAWFAWSNSFFGYLINKVANERPFLIFK